MLGPTYLAYFYCDCLTRPPDFCLDLETWQALRKESKVHPETKSQVAPAKEADEIPFVYEMYHNCFHVLRFHNKDTIAQLG